MPHDGWSGGVITSGSNDVLINGKPASTVGDSGTPHTKPDNAPHGVIISSGSSSVLINGKPAAFIGSAASCGSTVSSGSPDVIIG
jgi:uncharacterized Zn-binding protein involved in type VI secretion